MAVVESHPPTGRGGGVTGPWQRRDCRFGVELRVVLHSGNEAVVATTENISRRGALIRTDRAPVERQLFRAEFNLPDGSIWSTHAMVVHNVSPRKNRPAAIGIQFYAVPPRKAQDWDQAIARLPESLKLPNVRSPEGQQFVAPLPSRRQFQRFPVRLQLVLRTPEEIVRVYSANISAGGVLISTALNLELESRVVVEIIIDGGTETFLAEGRVMRRVHQGTFQGVGVEFTGLDVERREELFDFISSHLEEVAVDDDFADQRQSA